MQEHKKTPSTSLTRSAGTLLTAEQLCRLVAGKNRSTEGSCMYARYVLRLDFTCTTPHSMRALLNIRHTCETPF